MHISIAGLQVCVGILLMSWALGAPLIVGMVASLAFGSTALMTLSALGGSSPLIYVIFALLFCARMTLAPHVAQRISMVFTASWVPWAVCGLAIYAAVTAALLPRLFAGLTSVFVAGREYGVVQVTLAPRAGNLTQTSYFVLGALTFVGLSALLVSLPQAFVILRRALLTWGLIIALGGVLDVSGRMLGGFDILDPIRTASFAYLNDVEEAGFLRIAGTFSESSSFAAASLSALAFSFVDWRRRGSKLSGGLAVALFTLLVFSTSSTAYVCLAVMALCSAGGLMRSSLRGGLKKPDLILAALAVIALACLLFVTVSDPHRFDAFGKLIQSTVLDKSSSQSAKERSYWNQISLESLVDTFGIGIGFGSSRTSNWLIAVISQLGVIGTLLQLSLLIPLTWSAPHPSTRGFFTSPEADIQASLQACGATGVLSSILIGGSADPGLLFFVILAGLVVLRCPGRAQVTDLEPCSGDFGKPSRQLRNPGHASGLDRYN